MADNLSHIGNSSTCCIEDDAVEFNLFDDDDDLLLSHVDDIQTGAPEEDSVTDLDGINFDEEMEEDEVANISIGIPSDGFIDDNVPGFDTKTGNLWIYPTNYPVRDYQYNIVQQSLFKNTLVVLPTGLGKTFIAAVVMYNLYRWFPQGKIVFMAPTKPLVAQQINACYNIMGIPKDDTVEMTGTMPPTVRQKAWREKRVVFLTPQVITNDLSRGSCTAESIKCLVVDEAHKAVGNHSYCQVIRELVKFARQFRVLALSATPGSDLKAVQQVIKNLLISHIELRTEESIDIRPYTHARKVDKIVVPLGEELTGVRLQYLQIMTCVVQRLIRNKVVYNREATKLSKFLLLKSREEFRQNPPQNLQQVQFGNIEADFALAISLYHGFELLQLHGLRSLYNYLMGIISGDKGYGRTRSELLRNADFNDIMENLRQKFSGSGLQGCVAPVDCKLAFGHPKMQRLEEIVVEHFKTFKKKGLETRVMIFSQYRDSVQEIASILQQHQPLVKVMPFIGQSSAGKTSKGYTQKEQLMVMKKFREGGYNTLVSTCVGEEGLDIGDVDLIICFDAHKSPIRLVQRMGRTGRKREGRIVMLMTEGKEEQIYNQSQSSKKTIHKAILNGARHLHFYSNNPRMVPSSIHPKCYKMFITVAADSKIGGKKSVKSGNKLKKISDVFGKKGAKKPTNEENLTQDEYESIREEFAMVSSLAKYVPKPKCICLNTGRKEESRNLCENVINFSEWMPWQNRLQKAHISGHSVQSVHLVKDAEFIQLQQTIGEEEDCYGVEMEKYLTDPNLSKSVGQSSIVLFLSTKPNQAHRAKESDSDEDKINFENQKSNVDKKTKRRTNVKPASAMKGSHDLNSIFIDSESSLDDDPQLGEKPDESCGLVKARNTSIFSGDVVINSVKTLHKGQQNKSSKQKSGNSVAKGSARRNGRLTALETKSKKSNTAKTRKDKLTSGERTFINSPNIKSKQKISGQKLLKNSGLLISHTEKMSTHGHRTMGNSEVELTEYDPGLEELRHSQRNSLSIRDIGNIDLSDGKCGTKQLIPGSLVPMAPDISEVALLFQNLKSGSDFAELDLESLVAEWSKSGNMAACEDLMHSNRQEFLPENPKGILKSFNKNFKDTSQHDVSLESKLLGKCVSCSSKGSAREKSNVNVSNSMEKNANYGTQINPLTIDVQTLEHIGFAEESPIKSPMFKSLVGNSSSKNRNILESTPAKLHHSEEEVSLNFNLELEDKNIVEITSSEEGEKIADNENENKVTFSLGSDAGDIDLDQPMPGVLKATTLREPKGNVSDMSSFITATQALDCLDFSSSDGSNDGHAPYRLFSVSKTLAKSPASRNSVSHGDVSLGENSPLEPPIEKNPSHSLMNHINNKSIEVKSLIEHHDITRDFYNANAFVVSNRIHGVHDLNFLDVSGIRDSSIKTPHLSRHSLPLAVSSSKDSSHDSVALDVPQFDLGFDLDDDVIPPTPCKNPSHVVAMGLKNITVSRHASLGHLDTTSKLKVTRPFHSYSENFKNSNKWIYHSSVVRGDKREKSHVYQTNLVKSTDIKHTLMGSAIKKVEKQVGLTPCTAVQIDKVFDATSANGIESCIEAIDEFPLTPDNMDTSSVIESTPDITNSKFIFKTKHGHLDKMKQNVSEGSERISNLIPVQRVKRPPDNQQKSRFIDMINKESGKLMSPYVNSDVEETDLSVPPLPKKVKLSKHFSAMDSSLKKNTNLNTSDDMIWSKNDPKGTGRLDIAQEGQKNVCSEILMSKLDTGESTSNNTGQANKLRLGRLRLGEKRERFHELNRPSKEAVLVDISVKTDSVCTSSSNIFLKELVNVDLGGKVASKQISTSSHSTVEIFSSSKGSAGFKVSENELVPREDDSQGKYVVPYRQKGKLTALGVQVKASTPIRHSVAKKSISADDDMNLTPIEKINRPNLDAGQDEPEESFIIKRRKKPAAVLLDISSGEEESKDKIKTKETDSSSAHNSSRSWTTGKMPKFLLSDNGDDDDDEEDFHGESNRKIKPSKLVQEKFCYRTKNRKRHAFIEEEAEVSGEDHSSDECEEFDDDYDASFIDNNTEAQHINDTEMRVVYLKSVKSPLLHAAPGHFKLQYNIQNCCDVDIYSQALPDDQGMSEYEEDSFCVGSDERETSHTEDESLGRFTKISKQPKKGKKFSGKRRIHVMCDSSSDEDAGHLLPMTQDFLVTDLKRVKKALLSSSEDEEAKLMSKPSPNNKGENLRDNATCDNVSTRGNQSLDSSYDEKVKPLMNTVQEDLAQTVNFNLLEDDDWYDDADFLYVDEVKTKSTVSSTVGSSRILLASSSRNKATAVIAPTGFTPGLRDSILESMKQTTSSGSPKFKCDGKNINELNNSDAVGASQCSDLFFRGKRENLSDQSFTKKLEIRGDKYDGALLKNVTADSSTVQENTVGGNTCIVNAYQSGQVLTCSGASLNGNVSIKKSLNESLHSCSSEMMTSFNKPSTSLMTREERLRRQKEKQEKFRQKLQQEQQCSSTNGPSTSNGGELKWSSSMSRLASSVNLSEISSSCCSPVVDVDIRGQVSPNFTKVLSAKKSEELQILVDSREISGAQDIISALRIKHGIKVTARQLSSCDYILSNQQAVDRILWSAFSSCTNKSKMAARLSEMQALYDRCILIVEADRVKADQEKSKKTWQHNKYVDTTMSQIIQTRIKLYFSDSMDQTAALLSELCHIEAKKGRALTVSTSLNSRQEEILKFILTIPRVTVPQALNLVHHYRSIAELIFSSPAVIQERGRMTAVSAHSVHQFLHHSFDLQMMPNSK